MDDLLAEFLNETAESIAELDSALVKLERSPDDQATLGLIFRLVHTIKGTCGFLGLPRLERVAHAAENVLGQVRDGQLIVDAEIISAVLAAIDCIKMILGVLSSTGAEPAGADTVQIAALDRLLAGSAEAPAPHPRPADDVFASVQAVEAASAPVAAPGLPVAAGPPVEPPVPARPGEASLAVQEAPTRAVARAGGGPQGAADISGAVQTIRVGVDVLEHLMTLVGELVLARNRLLQLARGEENNAFVAPLEHLSHITSELQEGVMKTRMQPIGNAWNKLPRLIRDLSHELRKKIELVMLGQDTELDRQVLELIRDPLTHMVRNSADHGLESTARRLEVGKPEAGQITLNAFHEGGHVVIEVSDDGGGLDADRIRAKVASQGLATEAELAAMPDAQLHRFIFHAGFSTAAVITAVSGRGVGMDVVRTNVERIGGVIDLRSVPGQGTTFTIKIPLTLAIVSALIVQAMGQRFAIPQLSVVELVGVGAAGTERAIEMIHGTPVLRLRDRLLPLVDLNTLLRLDVDEASRRKSPTVVVVAVGSSALGIIVDRVFDTEEIVVKPVSRVLRHITMFSGNTILGDGSVIMILDPNGIARASGIVGGREGRIAQAATVDTHSASEPVALLLFRTGSGAPKAVPLQLVARLEVIPRERIEIAGGAPVTQYRGKLMPLVCMDGASQSERANQPIVVFSDRGRTIGLMVDEIVDVVQDRLVVEIGRGRGGLLGTAVIAGQSTDVVDIAHWLEASWDDWFGPEAPEPAVMPEAGKPAPIAIAAPAVRASESRELEVEEPAFHVMPAFEAVMPGVQMTEVPMLAEAVVQSGESSRGVLDGVLTWLRALQASHPGADVASVIGRVTALAEAGPAARETALLAEIDDLGSAIETMRRDMAALPVDDIAGKYLSSANDELGAIVNHTAAATETILDGCETLDDLAATLSEQPSRIVQDITARIYEACSFQDITGQRIAKIVATLQAIEGKIAHIREVASEPARPHGIGVQNEAAGLLNGPQLPDMAMDQSGIDRLLADF